MEKRIEAYLEEREEQGLLRKLHDGCARAGGRIVIDGKEYVNLSSNDYLGLASHPYILRAMAEPAGVSAGSTASRLMGGNTALHAELETRVAGFRGKEAALVFNSGYQANTGTISALASKGDAIFADRLCHASIIDGMVLSGARFFRYRHNDMDHLRELLRTHRRKYDGAMVITESVFSMEGDIAPVEDIISLKEEFDVMVMIDEAHATGVFGGKGEGLVTGRLAGKCDVIMGTFGKAFGVFGAYIASSRTIKEYLVNSARSFIYSTALPPAVINADLAALEMVEKGDHRRKELHENVAFFRKKLKERGVVCLGETQIVPVVLGDAAKASRVSGELRDKGWMVTPVRPPTVPAGSSRLRISITYDHKKDLLEKLAEDIWAAAGRG